MGLGSNIRRAGLALWLAGCAGPERSSAGATARDAAAGTPASGATAAPSSDAVLSELDARTLLADGLRRAGYRIRHDVARPIAGGVVVLDGWDDERQVGFEYVAVAEGDPRLERASRAALGDRILVVDPAPAVEVRATLARFVAALPPR